MFEPGEGRRPGTPGWLVLESGAAFPGTWIGAAPSSHRGPPFGEVVFNTCMTGYQEVCTDPSYAGQILVFTQPLIGNVGIAEVDLESARAWCRGVLVAECSLTAPHWQAQATFGGWKGWTPGRSPATSGTTEPCAGSSLPPTGVPCRSWPNWPGAPRQQRTRTWSPRSPAERWSAGGSHFTRR